MAKKITEKFKQMKVKPGVAYTKSGEKKISGTATTSSSKKSTGGRSVDGKVKYLKQEFPKSRRAQKEVDYLMKEFGPRSKKMNALDAAISKGKPLPSKNKKGSVPPDYDVIMPGMGYTKPTRKNPPQKSKATPVPLAPRPKNLGPAIRPTKRK